MLRSFHYIAHAVLYGQVPGIVPRQEENPTIERWAHAWYTWVSAIFLSGYFEATENESFVPQSSQERAILLDAYMLEKALQEIEYELEHRPDWTAIPMYGILEQLR